MEQIKKVKVGLLAVVAGATVGIMTGLLSGVAIADSPGDFPVNDNGSTFGSAAEVEQYERGPDLVLAEASNGEKGYVYESDLVGTPPKSPEMAVAEHEERLLSRSIPVYESDGVTIIGEFLLTTELK